MSTLDYSYPGSFRGADFLINSHSIDFGRKTATHEFVNSDNRNVEDLGKLNRSFQIQGFVTGQGADYYARRDNLINELNQKGEGLLSHPFYGAILVKPLTHSVSETISEINVARFTMAFAEDQPNVSASSILGSVSEVFNEAEEAVELVEDDIQSVYNVSTGYPENYESAFSKITNVSTAVSSSVSTINTDTSFINDYNAALKNYNDTITQLVSSPDLLSDQVSGLFLVANNVAATPTDGFNFAQSLFDFGSDDSDVVFNTLQYQERIKNLGILNAAMQAFALIYAFKNAVLIGYVTVTQVREISEILNAQFLKVYGNDYLSFDTQTQLADLRIAMAEFFKQAEINAYKIVQITTSVIPATVLAYQYYGSIDQVDNLIGINNIANVSFVEGKVDILTK